MDRIATFKTFIEKKPDDPFPRYALAMEYRNTGQYAQAQKLFAELATRFPDYLATYLMSGNNLVDLGRQEDAKGVYRKGIEVCQRLGEGHTKAELEAALDEL